MGLLVPYSCNQHAGVQRRDQIRDDGVAHRASYLIDAIDLGQVFGTFTVVIFSILPTLVYLWSVRTLGSPVGNLDWGAAIGSFVGLLAIGAAYTAVALMASALTPNNVVAFVLGVALNFGMYLGFESLADLYKFSGWELTLRTLGMNEHYLSMARGVLDLRDVGYFIGVVFLFIGLTLGVLAKIISVNLGKGTPMYGNRSNYRGRQQYHALALGFD